MSEIKQLECVDCPLCKYSATRTKLLIECKDCKFHGGIHEIDGNQNVICYVNEIPDFAKAHVTSFEKMENWKIYRYDARHYDPKIDGPIEGDDPEDYCLKCCFDKKLPNGERICTLRCGVDHGMLTAFCCYEGEIWTKTLVNDLSGDSENEENQEVDENQ